MDLLSDLQRCALSKGGINTVDDILFTPTQDIVRNCKLIPSEVSLIVDTVCGRCRNFPRSLSEWGGEEQEAFTTGDANLDRALDGGIWTSMVWEIAGESAAGKTQFALQLSLTVQLPRNSAGLEGSACYLTTKSDLQTVRLQEILDSNHLLSTSSCSLDDIHTLKVPTASYLIQVLEDTLPTLIERLIKTKSRKRIRLIVIDALTELFHSTGKTSSDTLKKRSRELTEIASLLHRVASQYSIAVLILNEVIDVFDQDSPSSQSHDVNGLIYREQRGFFSSAENMPGECAKEAGLGLTWANHINSRIFFARTGRRRHVDDTELSRPAKRQRAEGLTGEANSSPDVVNADPTLIRRLTIIFNPIMPPVSLDYVVTPSGIVTLASKIPFSSSRDAITSTVIALQSIPPSSNNANLPLDFGLITEDDTPSSEGMLEAPPSNEIDDELETFLQEDEDIYVNLDYSALDDDLKNR